MRAGRSLFAAPTSAGALSLLLAALLALIGLRAANAWLLLIGCALFAPVVISQLIRPDLSTVSVCFRGLERVGLGQTSEQVFHVHNRGRRSTPALGLNHRHPAFEPIALGVPGLAPGERAELTVHRRAVARGITDEHEVELASTAPMGLSLHRRRIRITARISVHPAPAAAADLSVAGAGDQAGGRAGRVGTEPHALREWQHGDPLRQVHWRATARHDRLTVVIPEAGPHFRIALVVAGQGEHPDWEALLSGAAWTAVAVAGAGHGPIRLSATGVNAYRGEDPEAVLDWFAGLPPVDRPTAEVLRAATDWAGPAGVTMIAATGPLPSFGVPPGSAVFGLGPDGQVRAW